VGAPEPVWTLWRKIEFLAPAGIQTPDRQARALFTTLTTLSLLLVAINKQHKLLCSATVKASATAFCIHNDFVSYDYHNKQQLYPQTTLNDWSCSEEFACVL